MMMMNIRSMLSNKDPNRSNSEQDIIHSRRTHILLGVTVETAVDHPFILKHTYIYTYTNKCNIFNLV